MTLYVKTNHHAMSTILSFIFVLGVLIFVHELGHFLFAKLFGVRVLKFSLGFGTPLVSKKWGDTEYQISALPLGGYVKMYGEQVGEEVAAEEKALSFSHKTVFERFGIVFAGPLFNLIFAVFAFWLILTVAGKPNFVDSTVIGQVNPGSVAEHAGLRTGDLILFINEQEILSWNQVSESIRDSGGQTVRLKIRRGHETLDIEAVPVMDTIKNFFGEEVGQRYLLGISRAEEVIYEQISPTEAVGLAFVQSWRLIDLTIKGIIKMVQRIIPASELGGPILIAELTGQQYQKGWIDLLYFMGLLSINLAILNLLPIPILDGGHLVFLTIEALLGRPLSEGAMIRAQQVGLALLGTLMIFVFYNDIARLAQRWFVVP